MRSDYYTNEKDYRPNEGPFDSSDYRYQQMERDQDRSEPVGSEMRPINNRRRSRNRDDRTPQFDRGRGGRYTNEDRYPFAGEEEVYASYTVPDERYGREDIPYWGSDISYHPGYQSENHSPFAVRSQFGGGESYGSRYESPAERSYVNHSGKGPRGYRRSSERVREEISEALMWNEDIDATDIEVKVENCEVTLTGFVDSRYAKRLAEDLAEAVRGVNDVHNHLRVRRGEARDSDRVSDSERASESDESRESENSSHSRKRSEEPRSTH